MPKRTKSRALYILKYLWLYTDDEHPASISDLTAIEDELVEQRKAVLELFKKKRAGEISPTEYDRKYAEYSARIIELESAADTAKSEDHYPIKRVVVFFYLHGVAKSTYRPTHSRKSPEKRDFVVHTQPKADRKCGLLSVLLI